MKEFKKFTRGDIEIVLDPGSPHWFAGDSRAVELFSRIADGVAGAELAAWYSTTFGVDLLKASIHTGSFTDRMRKAGFPDSKANLSYSGRGSYLSLENLKELWIHTNNSCNLACRHCLVKSSPKGDAGPRLKTLFRWIDEGVLLGVERFYFTGGEPFYRPDIVELIRRVILDHERELIIISNGTLFSGEVLSKLESLPLERLKLQLSLDGLSPRTNDYLRGRGSFEGALAGIKCVKKLGIETVLTTVIHPKNLDEAADMPEFARELGIESIHYMWPHLRGRFLERESSWREQAKELRGKAALILQRARTAGVAVDNYESVKWKVNGKPGVKFDLSGSGWESLCIYADGAVYPSAAFANHKPLRCGLLGDDSLETIWRKSPVLEKIRSASLVENEEIRDDPFRFLVGGGDIEHAYFFSSNGREGSFTAPDPYYPIYAFFAKEALFETAERSRERFSFSSGYDGPRVYHVMGEGAIIPVSEDEQRKVLTLHSNCVLAFDVEKPRNSVKEFYGKAGNKPQADLCCPVKPDKEDVDHIPPEVIDRFYGCGSPVKYAGIKSGEVFLDLGSGAGIDCFVAAKKVGAKGKVLGVDMTESMLSVARESNHIVSRNLGYDVVEFREGFLEQVPVESESVDVITSNCVINLSLDKRAVFSEMERVLKNCGRIVVSDIVAGSDVPASMRLNPILWGECLSGALTQDELFYYLEDAGFYGIEILSKSFWKEAEGCRFYSLTFRAYKYSKKGDCRFKGQRATYLGPFKGVSDEEGHYFPRNIAVEICTDTFNRLSSSALGRHFHFSDENGSVHQEENVCDAESCCC